MEKLDIRTHLIVLISATLFWFVFQSNAEIHCLVVLCALYMCVAGYWEKAPGFIMTYIIMLLLAYLTAPIMGIMYVVICTFARAIPLTMVAAPILYANPSRMMYSFQRIHVPKNVLVMLCILIRFFPVIEKEMLSIRNGIRARGIFPTWWSILKNPIMAYECFFVPLTVRCLKLSTELGASAELRGLDSSNPRSCIYNIGFTYKDILAILGFVLGCIGVMLGVRTWLS